MKKHIVCFGDSNTHGYCADPKDCADGGIRYNESERWTCLLEELLGPDTLVLDEIYSVLMSHEPVDLLIIMLGTNDTKERFSANAACIGIGMERLIMKAKEIPCWRDKPRILVISPPHIGEGLYAVPEGEPMGAGCPEKSRQLAKYFAAAAERQCCAFFDAESVAEFNTLDCMHLTRRGHRQLADVLGKIVPELLD